MSNETTTEHKSSLADIKAGDTIITIRSTGHGPSYSRYVVIRATATQIFVDGTVAYRRKDGQRVGKPESLTVAYAPNQVVNRWSEAKETALQLMEAHNAKQKVIVQRNNNMRYIERNMEWMSNELLAQIVALMTDEKAKKEADFAAEIAVR